MGCCNQIDVLTVQGPLCHLARLGNRLSNTRKTMFKINFVVALTVALSLISTSAWAEGENPHDGLTDVAVGDLATMLEAGDCRVFDANGESTRSNYGVIPGATLLSSYDSFTAEDLGGDTSDNVVFYCANTRCSAAPSAARRAQELGYENVLVLAAGIMGWVEAGQPGTAVETEATEEGEEG